MGPGAAWPLARVQGRREPLAAGGTLRQPPRSPCARSPACEKAVVRPRH